MTYNDYMYTMRNHITLQGILNVYHINVHQLSLLMGIPYSTAKDWASGRFDPPDYVICMIAYIMHIDFCK